jgi:hypothetical protein
LLHDKETPRSWKTSVLVRELLGIQQRTITDPNVWKTLPPGEYIVVNPQTGFKEVRPKY